ncbi:hypothetical protein [Streptomyces alboflavus]|uniref:hypothetical protein n=1 Tax=Streptomyces alboflavus TaxID=67267 RepID=UPI0036B302B2
MRPTPRTIAFPGGPPRRGLPGAHVTGGSNYRQVPLAAVAPRLVDLNQQLGAHILKFGPEPTTHSHCSLGG